MPTVTVQSLVSHKTREPRVSIYWPSDSDALQMSTQEARAFALNILESAEAAEQDAFMMAFATKEIGLNDAGGARLLNMLREYRKQEPGT